MRADTMNISEEIAELMQTTPKNAVIRAMKLRLTPVCGRCGGSGHYSYNQISGTVCFSCNGYGCKVPSERNREEILINVQTAIDNGTYKNYLDGLEARKKGKVLKDKMFSAWRASIAAKNNPKHWLRDDEITPFELAAREANSRIANAYRLAEKLDCSFEPKATNEKLFAWNEAIENFFNVIKETDAELKKW